MRRREIVAGLGSVGTIVGAGGLLLGGMPSLGADSGSDTGDDGALTVDTIDARGSEAGTRTVPTGDVMVLELFVTGCGNCRAQLPNVAAAHSQLATDHGDEVTFLGITFQSPETKPPAELRDWWRAHGGNWAVGYDPMGNVAANYGFSSYPTTIVTDADGEKHWGKLGITRPAVIVDHVESALETSSDGTTNASVDATSPESTVE